MCIWHIVCSCAALLFVFYTSHHSILWYGAELNGENKNRKKKWIKKNTTCTSEKRTDTSKNRKTKRQHRRRKNLCYICRIVFYGSMRPQSPGQKKKKDTYKIELGKCKLHNRVVHLEVKEPAVLVTVRLTYKIQLLFFLLELVCCCCCCCCYLFCTVKLYILANIEWSAPKPMHVYFWVCLHSRKQ